MHKPTIAAVAVQTILLMGSGTAVAQVFHNPPLEQRPGHNMMLVMDATRTTLINGETCRGMCHAELNGGSTLDCGGHGGEYDCNILLRGETRLQLARRVLTGGYGWNTMVTRPDGSSADASVRNDGIMDIYRGIRFGVTWYDGLGPRLAIDPTADNTAAQKAVIDFAQAPNDAHGFGADPGLNSYLSFPRTTQCCGNTSGAWNGRGSIPWFADAQYASGRMSRALQWVKRYWDPGVDAEQWNPPASTAGYPQFFSPGMDPKDESVINTDIANVLNPSGCRRNITVLMTDGHGGGSFADGASPSVANGDAAGQIFSAGGLPASKANLVFAIHFGVQDKANADRVADQGWDGAAGGAGITQAFEGAPGGAITDLTPMIAGFAAIFNALYSGEYASSAPTVSRFGDKVFKGFFNIKDCNGKVPWKCNIGRPGSGEVIQINPDGTLGSTLYDVGDILRRRSAYDRSVYTGHPSGVTETNCGANASCASKGATMVPVSHSSITTHADYGLHWRFLIGDPYTTFANGVWRGDNLGDFGAVTNSDYSGAGGSGQYLTDPYKLGSLPSGRAVFMQAPPSIGTELDRWLAFLNKPVSRIAANGGNGASLTVASRDQVMFVGGNDGMLNAFLTGKAMASATKGQSVEYEAIGTACASAPAGGVAVSQTPSPSMCDGLELWAYTPRFLQKNWKTMRGGEPYMLDATPAIDDVLFTKDIAAPAPCPNALVGDCSGTWEYRTALVMCAGLGSPGCFALDVTNPYDPQLLWEREFTGLVGKGSSTSRPVIANMRKSVAGKYIPYSVAIMGGGFNEGTISGKKGSIVVVGIEDGAVYYSPSFLGGDFASSPSVLDVNGDGAVDTGYIADTYGRIVKFRIPTGDPADGINFELFFDGQHANASNNPDIRTFSKVVATPTSDNKIALFMVSGNVEDAKDPNETNYLFRVKDEEPKALKPWTAVLNADRQKNSCQIVPDALTQVTDGVLQLDPGEKVLNDGALFNGSFVFTSFLPEANPCLPGQGFLYGVRYDTCDEGLDTTGNGQPDEEKVSLGAGLPAEVTVNYATNDLYVANSDNSVTDGLAFTPRALGARIRRPFWKRM